MADRILIADSNGRTLACMDGHHGAHHAADWVRIVRAEFAAKGIETVALVLHPAAGGDDFRREVLEQAGRVRVVLHARPDGKREIVGLSRGQGAKNKHGRASVGAAHAVTCGLRLLAAPADIYGARHPLRIPRGRANPAPGQPRTDAERRLQRRAARAAKRKPA